MRKVWMIRAIIETVGFALSVGLGTGVGLWLGLAPLRAYPQTAVNWGGTGCAITTVTGQPHVAEITCHNVLTGGVTHNRGVVMLDGQPVEIIATMGPGDVPDRFEVIPPVGYTADPAVDVPEGGQAVIRVYPMLLG